MTIIDIFTDGVNFNAFAALSIKFISITIIAAFIMPIQVKDIARGLKDGLQRLRYYILGFLSLYLLFNVAPFIYQYYRMLGLDYGALRDISSISSNLAQLAIVIWLVLVYTYNRKIDK